MYIHFNRTLCHEPKTQPILADGTKGKTNLRRSVRTSLKRSASLGGHKDNLAYKKVNLQKKSDEKVSKDNIPDENNTSKYVSCGVFNTFNIKRKRTSSNKTIDLADGGDTGRFANNEIKNLALQESLETICLKDNDYTEIFTADPLLNLVMSTSTDTSYFEDSSGTEKIADNALLKLALPKPKKSIDLGDTIKIKKLSDDEIEKLTPQDSKVTRILEDNEDAEKQAKDEKKSMLKKNIVTSSFEDSADIVKIADEEIIKLSLKEKSGREEHTKTDIKTSSYLLDSFYSVGSDKRGATTNDIEEYLKTGLYKAIEENNVAVCQSFLASKHIASSSLLATALAKAEDSDNLKIVKTIYSSIVASSSEIVLEFYNKYDVTVQNVTVWMGRECLCENKYEDEFCQKPKPCLIVETNAEAKHINFDENFQGFPIRVITENFFMRKESKEVAHRTKPESQKRLDRVPKSVAKRLFKKHSNLTMVCPSAYKSIGFKTKDHTIMKVNCISLFCRIKGIIPIGEPHFPLKINGVQTDVLEGTSFFSSAVQIGDKIYNSKGEIGTLGGFVKYYGIDTFLTCAHVIFGKSNISNLQTKDIHFNCHTIKSDNKTEPVKCTLIRHILKYDTQESEMEEDGKESGECEDETSIDAALVLIQMPNTLNISNDDCGAFLSNAGIQDTTSSKQGSTETAVCTKTPVELRIKLQGYGDSTNDNLSALGLKSIYLNDNFIETEEVYNRAIALSAISGEQERLILLSRSRKLHVPVPSHVRINTNIMYNQFVIQNMDFQEGDSGTCIYTPFTGSEEKGCIGMLVGKSTSGECIVTPMKEILKALEVDIKA